MNGGYTDSWLIAMNKRKLVYILSPSYSGSTLLTMMLAKHPQIATVGELKATSMGDINKYICSCGDPILDCVFWISLKKQLKFAGVNFDLDDFGTHFRSSSFLVDKVLHAQIRSPSFEKIREVVIKSVPRIKSNFLEIQEKNKKMIDTICALEQKEIFLDGSKDPQRLLYFIRSNYWDVRVIRMYRDGRAQSNSNRKKESSKMDFKKSALEWKSTMEQIQRVSSYTAPSQIYTLSYEALCEDPNQKMKRVCEFLGVEEMDCDWKELNMKEFNHHILGNSMRIKDKIYISLDQDWKRKLTDKEINIFEKIAGDMNRTLGYLD